MRKSILTFLMSIILTFSINATVPSHISYQGKVDDTSGQPMSSGNYQMTFSLFRTAVGGTAVWSSGSQTVAVNEGLFSYELGAIVPFPNNLTSDSALWLEVSFYSEIITPRIQFSSVGFALKAQTADTALYAYTSSAYTVVNNKIQPTTPGTSMKVEGSLPFGLYPYIPAFIRAEDSGQGSALLGWANNSIGVTGDSENGYGVLGRSLGTGRCFVAQKGIQTTAFIGGPDTGLYVNSLGNGIAGRLVGDVEIAGNLDVDSIKIGAAIHEGLLHVEGTGNATAVIGSSVDGRGVIGRAYGASGVGLYSMVDQAKGLVIDRNGGPNIFMGYTDTGLYINTYGSGYAAILEGNVKVIGNTDFFGPITSEGIWSNGYGSGDGVHAGQDGSGTGKCFSAERAGGVTAFIGGVDTGLYVNQPNGYAGVFEGPVYLSNTDQTSLNSFVVGSGDGIVSTVFGYGKCFTAFKYGFKTYIGGDTALYVNPNAIGTPDLSKLAGYFNGAVEVIGNLGAGISQPDAQLQVKGGNWNPGLTEGDFKIGNATHRFKIGLATSGGGAGDVRMRADGGTNRLILGSALNDVLTVKDTRVGIGTLSPNYTLDVRGNIGNNTTLYHSDKRWKKNIHSLENSLYKILQLQGVSFDWRIKEFAEMNFPSGTKVGLIAQDVEKILPNIVHTDKNGYKSVEYANIVVVLIEAVKEQQKEIDELRKLIDEK